MIFFFTGEVLGERPMSQNKTSLHIVAKMSGYQEYVLRPLSAKLLPETKPELDGKVDRSRLFDLSGRQRKRQFEMAKEYGLKDFPTPASGCLLTDPGFSKRLKDLLTQKKTPSIQDVELLKVGRHIKLDEKHKIVVGRNKSDNDILDKIDNKDFLMFTPRGVRGPSCMVPGCIGNDLLDKAIKICASYCDAKEGDEVVFQSGHSADARRVKTVYSKANRPTEFIGV
ncbi:hypothetical protein ACFL3J_00165 [Candidatus Omnitrophota bacterium]